VADDHGILRRGVIEIIRDSFPEAYVVEAGDGEEALAKCLSGSWDLIILDVALPKLGGIEILRRTKQFKPDLPIIMLSMHLDLEYVLQALKLGASGYLGKEGTPTELTPAIHAALNGATYLSRGIAKQQKEQAIVQ
jgi:DNA-binding NarL/FixJ family response regulator